MSTPSPRLRLKHKIGDVIADRYEIVEEIKSGGMGTVYKVRDQSLGLYYACKEMDILDKREEFLDKFRREAVNLQKLHNPHIPKAFYVEHKGVWLVCPVCGDTFYGAPLSPCHKQKPMVVKKRYYLMMEFIEGEDLEERIEKEGKPLREEDVVRWTLDVCSALKEIHSMGMVHRDVKPDNIMIDSKNRAYLLDMGLVKETVIESSYGTVQMSQTSNMGTPGYAPIEQYRYGSPESRSDIYALGMTMYRLLANKDPRDPIQITEMDRNSPKHFNANISDQIEQIILKATKEKAEDRFKNIDEFIMALKGGRVAPVKQPAKTVSPTSSPVPTGAVTLQDAEELAKRDAEPQGYYCTRSQNAKFNWTVEKSEEKGGYYHITLSGAPGCFDNGETERLLYKIDKAGNIVSTKEIRGFKAFCTSCPYVSAPQRQVMPPPPVGTVPPVSPPQSIFSKIFKRFFHPQPQLEGTVISVDPLYDEPPDRDFAKLCLGILAVFAIIPFLFAALMMFILLASLLSIFRLGGLVSALNPLNFFSLLAIFGIGRRAADKRVPVRNFRVRDANGNEYQVRMKGRLKIGNVATADKLTIWGKWRGGTFIFKKAYNHRIRSEVKLKQSLWPKILLGIIGFFILIGILGSLGGRP